MDPVLISDPTNPAVIVTLAITGLSLFTLIPYSIFLYLGRTWRIVKMRGLIHLQFLLWSLFFIAVYNIILVLAGLYQWPFYVAWTVICLRRYAFLFAIFSLLTFQVILASIRNLAGQIHCFSWLKWLPRLLSQRNGPVTADQADELQFLLRRCVLISVLGYLPVFVVSMIVPILANDQGGHYGYLSVYIVTFIIFIAVIITSHCYLIFTQHIPRYYSHNRSHVVMLLLTDLLVVGWVLYWAIAGQMGDTSTSFDYNNPDGVYLLAEANFSCIVILIWLIVYCSPAVIAIFLASCCNYPAWRDDYENYLADQRNIKKSLSQPANPTLNGSGFSDSFETVKSDDKLLDVIMSTLSGAKLLALV